MPQARRGEDPPLRRGGDRLRPAPLPLRELHRQLARHEGGLRDHPEGRADRGDRAHQRRERHRQGSGRARDPPLLHPRQAPVGGGELRGDSRRAARKRDVRPRQGRVHRRGGGQGGPLRGGVRRYAVPRRDRVDAAHPAGQAPARAAGEGNPPRRRHQGDSRRCARHRRVQLEPRGGGGEGHLPQRPLLPLRRHHHRHPAAPRAPRGHHAARPALHRRRINDIKDDIFNLSFKKVKVSVDENNILSLRLFEKAGFKFVSQEDELKNYEYLKNNKEQVKNE